MRSISARCREFLLAVLLACAILSMGDRAVSGQSSTDGPQSYAVLKNLMVPMRDGVRLATDLYFPASNGARIQGKLPAILERTPYDKDHSENLAAFYASHGYVYVAQDTRGRYGSEDVWHMMTDDVNDGYDTAKWVVAQPWSS